MKISACINAVHSATDCTVSSNGKTQIRLDKDVEFRLTLIRKECAWPVSLAVLANYAARNGIPKTKRAFNQKRAA